jgi:Na+/H+ antiporter NhaD/arsenite permease-like protein
VTAEIVSTEIVSTVIFVLAIVLILTERLDRAIVAVAGAAAMVTAGIAMGFYDEEMAIASIDFDTLGLLFGMMILIALLKPTGLFEYMATAAAIRSRGRPVLLLVLLAGVTTLVSMFLDNVTTVVLIAPLTILIAEVLGISAVPLLMAEALLSDTGGVATLVGDPPNVLIGSAADLTFTDFLTRALPVVAVAWIAALFLLLFLFRKELSHRPTDPEVLSTLTPPEALHDWPTARKLLIVLGLTLVLFMLQGTLHLAAGFIALSMAGLALVWVRPPVSATFESIEWPVLIFFGGLFVLVGGLEAAGVLAILGGGISTLMRGDPVLSAIALMWIVAILSALVDNVPVTVAMIPIIQQIGLQGVDVAALWWALAFGAGFGGNGTIIGSTANIVVVEASRRTKEPLTSQLWTRRGLPVMIVTLMVASAGLAVFYPWFQTR